jgi:hypothetical protein
VQLDLTAENLEPTIVEKVVLIRSVYESKVGRACESHRHEVKELSLRRSSHLPSPGRCPGG